MGSAAQTSALSKSGSRLCQQPRNSAASVPHLQVCRVPLSYNASNAHHICLHQLLCHSAAPLGPYAQIWRAHCSPPNQHWLLSSRPEVWSDNHMLALTSAAQLSGPTAIQVQCASLQKLYLFDRPDTGRAAIWHVLGIAAKQWQRVKVSNMCC